MRRLDSKGNRRGVALPLALFALVIMGALVSAAFVVGRHDRLGSTTTTLSASAQNAAESGLANMYATWDPIIHSTMAVWDGTAATEWTGGWQLVAGNSRLRYVDSVRRLNESLFLVRAAGQRLDAGGNVLSQLTLAQFFRLVKPTISVNAAITVQDPVSLNGNAFAVSGLNYIPNQWASGECPAVDAGNTDDVVGIRSSVGTGVTSTDEPNIQGFPTNDVPYDPTITSATFQNFLDYTYNTLASQPNAKVLASGTYTSQIMPSVDASTSPPTCNQADPFNFGEPYRDTYTIGAVPECYNYFPVVHGTGSSLKFAGSTRGQGTLLVDGDLEIAGNFEWVGLIIIRGKMKINGTGTDDAKIIGALLAEGVALNTSGSISGNVTVQYSKCAIDRAVGGATLARPLSQRAWAQLY